MTTRDKDRSEIKSLLLANWKEPKYLVDALLALQDKRVGKAYKRGEDAGTTRAWREASEWPFGTKKSFPEEKVHFEENRFLMTFCTCGERDNLLDKIL